MAVATQNLPTERSPHQTQFRSGVDLIQLDVSVLDSQRRPVMDLTDADFTIREDGRPQTVATFATVDIPPPQPPTAPWRRDVAPDAVTNQLDDRRLVVLVLDNWSGPLNTWEKRIGQQVARDVIDHLGPNDLTAAVVLYGSRYSQDFTTDRELLRASVEQKHAVIAPAFADDVKLRGGPLDVLLDVTEYLIDVPTRRKAVIYIGRGEPYYPQFADATRKMSDLFGAARRGNVNIYCFDINGLLPPQDLNFDPGGPYREFALTVSNNTGGRAVVNNNAPMRYVPDIFVENGSYYLLGYVPSNQRRDGRIRRLDVRVNRRGVTVRARQSYRAPIDLPANAPPAPTATHTALAGLLPNRDLPLTVALAPFAVPGRREAAVAIALGIDGATASPGPDGRPAVAVDLVARAFTPVGDPRGMQAQTARVTTASSDGTVAFDALTQLPLLPGRYELRLSAHDPIANRSGSVYASVQVPDFARDPLSLSGVLLSQQPGRPVGPASALSTLSPIVPTTVRTFAVTDRVRAFARAYQGGTAPPTATTVTFEIRDEHDRVVFTRTEALPPVRFDADTRAADLLIDLPLDTLSPGEHLLAIDVAAGAHAAARRVRFHVR